MKNKRWIRIVAILLVLIISLMTFLFCPTWTSHDRDYENGIYELKKVMINDVKLQVLLRGTAKTNPVMLVVPDGFDAIMSDTSVYEKSLEQVVTVVHFDLRGTGRSELGSWQKERTYFDILVDDILQLTQYLKREFKTDKILLAGHGTGSLLAMEALKQSPEDYFAYVGVAQMGDWFENDASVYAMLQNQITDLEKKQLEGLMENRSGLISRNFIQKHKPSALQWQPKLHNLRMLLFHSETNGWDFITSKRKAKPMMELFEKAYLKKYKDLSTFSDAGVPLYFVSGRYDYITPTAASQAYAESLGTMKKYWYEFTASAHYPHLEEPKDFLALIRAIAAKADTSE